VLDYNLDDEGYLSPNDVDDADSVPKCVVVERAFDWGDDQRPRTPLKDSIIYEVHAKGFTKQMTDIPEELRGTYAGLANVAATGYLKELGVTAIELLPIHAFVDDGPLVDRELRNYWGYNTLSFFAPDPRYAASTDPQGVIDEFKGMVKAMHAAGIEVILDVVYNHTCEGNHLGPSLSFRGIDNPAYYRISPEDRLYYIDFAGTGNTVNVQHPQVLKMVADSLRYWVEEMHIDGFRFDLAPALGREDPQFDPWSGFFDVIRQDPVLSTVKMIAEPWDLGPDGYQVGGFPLGWNEWNGRYRDEVRAFWRGDGGKLSELASRVAGSADIYKPSGRPATASINFIVAHDGFTLRDLVMYEQKHNEANGENNQDGHDDNLSANYGVEGPTDDPEIEALRWRQQRNLMATLLLSVGVPMICGGDELGRTQQGNNNAYCQDNEISWYDWDLSQEQRDLLEFTKRTIALRKTQDAVRRRTHLDGHRHRASGYKDITWIRPDGKEMQARDWNIGYARALAFRLGGDAIDDLDPKTGDHVIGDTLLVLLNASLNGVLFRLPRVPHRVGPSWEAVLDTMSPTGEPQPEPYAGGVTVTLPERSMLVLRQIPYVPRARRSRKRDDA
jgi:glycogen operon protein